MEKDFIKYQHIERFGTDEVENIDLGKCYIFFKIDGTNGSVWIDENENIRAGSRNRFLSIGSDNAGFCAYVEENTNIKNYLNEHPNHRLFGEWLVPHTIKTYRKEAWRKFYVFDVMNENGEYIDYDTYKPFLDKHGLDYIPPIAVINNPSKEVMLNLLDRTSDFLVEDGKGKGEGIVIKNYDFRNKYCRQTWAKIVCNEFKKGNKKLFGVRTTEGKTLIEGLIIDTFCTEEFLDKEFEKLKESKCGWNSKMIPMFLGITWNTFIKEETWNFIKKFNNPVIDFRKLNALFIRNVKEKKPELFA